ncbi:MAG TPA: hypothetical protein VHN20_15060 [Beijerinckiaceae bacterium]|nr:hypothetical protein [Beijerinckiaceae bacterium]
MRSDVYWRRAVFVALVAGGCFASFTPEFGIIGVGVAEAKSFYTRKRVNGVWVKGKFPKRNALNKSHEASSKRSRRSRSAALPVTTGSLSAAPEYVMVPAAAAPSSAAVETGRAPHRAWPMQSASAHPSAPLPQGSAIAQSTSATAGALAPQTVLSNPALPAARAPAVVPQMAPGAHEPPLVSPSDEQRLSKLREALQARASSLATGSSTASLPTLRPTPEPQSVTFDFKSGVKTTIFADGTIVEDAFDVASVRGMASTPPAATGSGLR